MRNFRPLFLLKRSERLSRPKRQLLRHWRAITDLLEELYAPGVCFLSSEKETDAADRDKRTTFLEIQLRHKSPFKLRVLVTWTFVLTTHVRQGRLSPCAAAPTSERSSILARRTIFPVIAIFSSVILSVDLQHCEITRFVSGWHLWLQAHPAFYGGICQVENYPLEKKLFSRLKLFLFQKHGREMFLLDEEVQSSWRKCILVGTLPYLVLGLGRLQRLSQCEGDTCGGQLMHLLSKTLLISRHRKRLRSTCVRTSCKARHCIGLLWSSIADAFCQETFNRLCEPVMWCFILWRRGVWYTNRIRDRRYSFPSWWWMSHAAVCFRKGDGKKCPHTLRTAHFIEGTHTASLKCKVWVIFHVSLGFYALSVLHFNDSSRVCKNLHLNWNYDWKGEKVDCCTLKREVFLQEVRSAFWRALCVTDALNKFRPCFILIGTKNDEFHWCIFGSDFNHEVWQHHSSLVLQKEHEIAALQVRVRVAFFHHCIPRALKVQQAR